MRRRVQQVLVRALLLGALGVSSASAQAPDPSAAIESAAAEEVAAGVEEAEADEVPATEDPEAEATEEEQAPVDETPEQPAPTGAWMPPLPSAKEFDWLQVRSGEWLKGEFLRLRDYEVNFDSDEFDELELDWKKVVAFYLPRPHSFRVAGRVLFGTAELRGDILRIRTEDGVAEFARSDLSAIAQGSGSELDWWSLELGLSVSMRRGNSKQTDLQGTGELRRESAVTRFISDYRGSFSRVDGDKTANNHRVISDFDLFLTRRFYWTIPFVEYYTDELQNIDARISPGSALGYEFFRNRWVEFEASLGGAYQLTLLSSDVDETRTSHDFAVVHTSELNFDLPGGTDWDNLYRLQLVVTDYGKTSHHAESVLSFDVWGPMDLDVSLVWDRIEEPADSDSNSDDPKKDDFRLLVGFTVDF